nr:2-alkenal reductase (NADP(+)-dependent)-like [Nicotiana tomentosiformis]
MLNDVDSEFEALGEELETTEYSQSDSDDAQSVTIDDHANKLLEIFSHHSPPPQEVDQAFEESKVGSHQQDVDSQAEVAEQTKEVIRALGMGKVIQSKDIKFSEGDIVLSRICPVSEFGVMPSNLIQKITAAIGIALPDYLSCLGMPGITAWVKLLKEECGYDDAFNYRVETDYDAALTKYFPNGIDVYFDNVGGKMLEAVLNHVNHGARIALCGMISEYNKVWTEREGVRNLLNMVGKEVMMKGFMVGSYYNHFEEFIKEMEVYLKEGKIKSKHKIYNGIESFLESLASLFSSSNVGKVILQVTP